MLPLRKTKQAKESNGEISSSSGLFLWIRILFLCYYGSLGSLLPYLPVYYENLGHGGQIIGLLGAVKPATTFLVAPLWGIIADAANSPFTILQITFLVSAVGQLMVGYSHDARYIMTAVFWTALFNAPVKSLMDSMVLEQLGPLKDQYGRLRLWGQLGFGIGSSVVGILLSKYSQSPAEDIPYIGKQTLQVFPKFVQNIVTTLDHAWRHLTGYRLLFFVYAALSVPTWFCMQRFRKLNQAESTRLQEESPTNKARAAPPSTSVLQGLSLLLHNADALLFFFLVFAIGTSSGVIENFAYVRLREVGGTGKEMGLSRLVSSIAGAPMFWFSGRLTAALGVDRVLVMSLVSYMTRFVIYSLMRNPYQGLPAEALRGVTFAAFWSSSTIFAHAISPAGLHATMLMFVNAMYGGLGQSLGAIVGGRLQDRYGTVRTFGYAAVADAALVAWVVFYLYVVRKGKSSFRDPKPIEAKNSR